MRKRSLEHQIANILGALPSNITNLQFAGGSGMNYHKLGSLLPKMTEAGLMTARDPTPLNGYGNKSKKVYVIAPRGVEYLKTYSYLLTLLGDALA